MEKLKEREQAGGPRQPGAMELLSVVQSRQGEGKADAEGDSDHLEFYRSSRRMAGGNEQGKERGDGWGF